jgi:HEPN domain-containing protein
MKKRIDWVDLWVKKAENDLITASACLKIKPKPPIDTICFHAQQCAEKYLKAFLASKGIDFEKTHDLSALIVLSSKVDESFQELIESAERLTPYAVEARYPSILDEELTIEQAKEAVKIAQTFKDQILPKIQTTKKTQKKL